MSPFSCLLSRIFLPVCLVAAGAELVSAHGLIDTNVVLDIELKESEIKIEPWLPTFLMPPLADIKFDNSDEWPTKEERQKAIEDYFHEVCPVIVDGKPVRPKMADLKLQPMEGAKHLGEVLDFVEARTKLVYQCESPPEKVLFTWGVFVNEPEGGWETLPQADHDPQEIDLIIFVDGKEDYAYFSPREPEFLWHRRKKEVKNLTIAANSVAVSADSDGDGKSKLPVGAIVAALTGIAFFVGTTVAKAKMPLRLGGLIACGVVSAGLGLLWAKAEYADGRAALGITTTEAVETFKALQSNLYSAFDYETEDQVYDVLSQSVDGELLDDIYTEVYHSLIVTDKGSSAVCKVQKVEVLNCAAEPILGEGEGSSGKKPDKATSFEIRCHWRVHGFVTHHEHTHRRVNEYAADFTLARLEEGWKITGIEVDTQNRLDLNTMKPSADYQ